MREVPGWNPGSNNTQDLKITDEKVLPLFYLFIYLFILFIYLFVGFANWPRNLTERQLQTKDPQKILCNDICKWLDFQVFSDKDYKQ